MVIYSMQDVLHAQVFQRPLILFHDSSDPNHPQPNHLDQTKPYQPRPNHAKLYYAIINYTMPSNYIYQ